VSTTNLATGLAANVYVVTVTDNSSCTVTASFTITQPTQLTLTETHTNNRCFGNATAQIIATVNGGTPGYTHQWNPNVSSNDSANNLAAGAYTITVTDQNACTVSIAVNVTSPPVLDISATATNALCFGDANGTITGVATGGTTPYNYALTNDGVNYQNSTSGQYNSLAPSTYTVLVTDANACVDSTTVTVTQPTQITSVVSAADASCYQYTDGTITVQAAGGSPAYTFSLSNGSQNSSGSFTGLVAGSYTVTISDANNCSITDIATIIEPAPVTLSVTPNPVEVKLGESIQLSTSTSQTGVVSYNWTPAYGLTCYDCASPMFSGNYTTEYTVNMTNSTGCTGTSTVTITVIPGYEIFIPNVFTPNRDGANDFWEIFGNLKGIKQLNVLVFNRWGEKVFESNDINFGWDGTFRGVDAPVGVYTYVARFVWLNNHADANYKGTITLMR
jgi:gliding motility-associated-like protein